MRWVALTRLDRVRLHEGDVMYWMTLAWALIGVGAVSFTVSLVFSEQRAAAVAKGIEATALCARCGNHVPAWFAGDVPTIGQLCWHCATGGRDHYPVPDQTKDGYVRLQRQLQPADLVQCPVCEQNVPRNQTQRTPVLQKTETGQSKHYKEKCRCAMSA